MNCPYRELWNGEYFCNLYYKPCKNQCKLKKKGNNYE